MVAAAGIRPVRGLEGPQGMDLGGQRQYLVDQPLIKKTPTITEDLGQDITWRDMEVNFRNISYINFNDYISPKKYFA